MIRALLTGKLHGDPVQRTGSSGKPFTTGKMLVTETDPALWCSLIAFAEAGERLASLRAGSSLSVAGRATLKTYEGKDGTPRVSLDLVADEIASTTPRPRQPRDARSSRQGGRTYDDSLDDIGRAS